MKTSILLALAALGLASCNKDAEPAAPDTPAMPDTNTVPPTGEEGTSSPEEVGGDTPAAEGDIPADGGMGDGG